MALAVLCSVSCVRGPYSTQFGYSDRDTQDDEVLVGTWCYTLMLYRFSDLTRLCPKLLNTRQHLASRGAGASYENMTHVFTPNPEMSTRWTHPDLQGSRPDGYGQILS